jgi:hypothetical protein
VTPCGVATALAHLGIPAMNRAVKEGWQVEFATPPVRVNSRGYQTTLSLPMGATPENAHRPHRSLHQQPPASLTPPPSEATVRPIRRDRLGGLIQEYVQVVA